MFFVVECVGFVVILWCLVFVCGSLCVLCLLWIGWFSLCALRFGRGALCFLVRVLVAFLYYRLTEVCKLDVLTCYQEI